MYVHKTHNLSPLFMHNSSDKVTLPSGWLLFGIAGSIAVVVAVSRRGGSSKSRWRIEGNLGRRLWTRGIRNGRLWCPFSTTGWRTITSSGHRYPAGDFFSSFCSLSCWTLFLFGGRSGVRVLVRVFARILLFWGFGCVSAWFCWNCCFIV